ncbi:hypothetical protein KXQ82_00580 [Mucilaginibacter sp. HMF5004]|uniref:hypothetical protein n=1 Tax=Mucilaginibacter rivuli TaxID=2857527 RepID=UPI001C5F1E26|nr:hypothetical protein [Mucilaginibacter rivuli]MBW4888182.1 hypothetical protein [Mucilaginibacter rivuli]
MKNYILILIHIAGAAILFTAACSSSPVSTKLKGEWHSTDGATILKITNKAFTLDSDSPIAEDYFVKQDTIFTSFEGALPYTKFVVRKVDDHELKLEYPDSALVVFNR